jgi:hypothetical protein
VPPERISETFTATITIMIITAKVRTMPEDFGFEISAKERARVSLQKPHPILSPPFLFHETRIMSAAMLSLTNSTPSSLYLALGWHLWD